MSVFRRCESVVESRQKCVIDRNRMNQKLVKVWYKCFAVSGRKKKGMLIEICWAKIRKRWVGSKERMSKSNREGECQRGAAEGV
jgi:hypothetical protein